MPASPTGFVRLMHNEAVCALLLAQTSLSTGPERGPSRLAVAATLRQCCRGLRDHVDSVVDEIRVKEKYSWALAASGLLARLPCLSKVAYEERSTGPLQGVLAKGVLTKLLRTLPAETIKSFKFSSYCDTYELEPPRSLETISGVLTGLTSLALSTVLLEREHLQLLGTMTRLRKLDLSSIALSSCVDVGVLRDLTQLTYLRLSYTRYNTDGRYRADSIEDATPVVYWGALLPHLLLLEECELDAASLDTLLLLGALPRLRGVDLQMHVDPAVAGAMDVQRLPAASFTALTSLNLRLYTLADADIPKLQQALSRMPALTKLLLSLFQGSVSCLHLPLQMASLQSLCLQLGFVEAPQFNDAFIVQLAKSLPQLQQLKVFALRRHCLSDAGFIMAARHFQRLRTIRFWDPSYSDDDDDDDMDDGGGGPRRSLVTAASALALAAIVPSLEVVEFVGGSILRSQMERGAQLLDRGEHSCQVRNWWVAGT